jgi:acetyltransferase-like isoleucine patch superfamily enzyme
MLDKFVSVLLKIRNNYRLSRLKLKAKGSNVHISPGFQFSFAENISIGDNVHIGPHSWINAIGGVAISSGTIIGPRLTIYSANHRYKDANAIPYDDVILPGGVEIGENTWIGGNVIIVPGVTIGEGCVVGAGSVVTKNMPSCHVLGGNPAKIIGRRDEKRYMQLKSEKMIYLALKSKGQMQPHIETDLE